MDIFKRQISLTELNSMSIRDVKNLADAKLEQLERQSKEYDDNNNKKEKGNNVFNPYIMDMLQDKLEELY